MKVILGIAGAYLLLLWGLCAALLIIRAPTVTYDWGQLATFLTISALFTVTAAAFIGQAWRRKVPLVAAVLTSLVAAAVLFWLLVNLLFAGG